MRNFISQFIPLQMAIFIVLHFSIALIDRLFIGWFPGGLTLLIVGTVTFYTLGFLGYLLLKFLGRFVSVQ